MIPNAIRQRLDEYDREPAGLIKMVTTIAGHKLVEELGAEQSASGDLSNLNDGVYVALFEDGLGIMVEYTSMDPGYSEYTPGWPASVEYSLLRKKATP